MNFEKKKVGFEDQIHGEYSKQLNNGKPSNSIIFDEFKSLLDTPKNSIFREENYPNQKQGGLTYRDIPKLGTYLSTICILNWSKEALADR